MAKKSGRLSSAASALGKKGGPARKLALSPQRRKDIAAMGGRAAQGKKK